MKETNKSVDIRDDFPYKDIINLDRPLSLKHPKSNRDARAAQFAPFAALTGFDEEIKEVQRYTLDEKYLGDDEIDKINYKLNIIDSNKELLVNITYFIKDNKKDGGKYINKSGFIRKIDSYNNIIIFEDKEKINIKDIVKIEIIDLSNDNNLI